MKTRISLLIVFFLSAWITGSSQSIVFHENFETVDSMISSGTPGWFQDSNFHTDGTHCIRDTVALLDTAYLTSISFSTVGYFFVTLSFDQICKISFADQGHVEVSNNNGLTWTVLPTNSYFGSSQYYP